jgi:hypothetical protein
MNSTQTQQVTSAKYPVSNFVYDLTTLISERCKGIEALKQYLQDAEQGGHNAFVQLANQMLQQDQQAVKELEHILANNLKGQ